MPVPSDTEPGRAGLPVIGLGAARELFRTAESSGLGRPGTDEIFDQWLADSCDIAFYRNAARPLQARPVGVGDAVPECLNSSRVGRARLEAVCLNPSRPAPPPEEEPAEVPTEREDETDEADESAGMCSGMPLCWHCEPDQERYAKVDNGQYQQDDEDGEGDDQLAVELVNAYRMMAEDPSFDLSGELPPDFRAYSIRALTLLTEVAQRRLDTERWDTAGPWHVDWFSCESDVTDPAGEDEDFGLSDDDPEGEPDAISWCASIVNDDGAPTLQIVGTRRGEQHVTHYAPVSGPPGDSPDSGTLDGLRDVLTRATEQLGEAGYEMDGEWTVAWSRCHVQLDD
ncbi:hypothetical protein ACWCY6_12930 [Streptomyces sp. 900105755]